MIGNVTTSAYMNGTRTKNTVDMSTKGNKYLNDRIKYVEFTLFNST